MNIAKILRGCPSGTRLYSPIYGELSLVGVNLGFSYPIYCRVVNSGNTMSFAKDGRCNKTDAEPTLFPSKTQRDWSKFVFTDKKTKYQFKPYDRVLVRTYDSDRWKSDLFSYADIENRMYVCVGLSWRQCIPYDGNENLLGTTNKPE